MAELIHIDDNNYSNFLNPVIDGQTKGRGLWGTMNLTAQGRSAMKSFHDLAAVPLLPESEWDDRIDQLEKDQATIRNLCEGMGLNCLDQQQTNYCWINAPTMACMVARLVESGTVVRLSPASAGARIKQFRNVGGWGGEALDWLKTNGVNEQADWPPNAISRQYDTADNHEKAKKNAAVEYYVLDNWQQTASTIISGTPVAIGLNWWSHEILGVGIVKGSHDLVIMNSWGTSWSSNGYGVLQGQKKIPDDAVAITSLVAA